MDIATFLKTVITTDEGYVNVLIGGNDIPMKEVWFEWPQDLDNIVDFAKQQKKTTNVYFTAHLFSRMDSHKEYVLPSRTIQADLDHGIPSTFRQPTILVETSPGRHQGYWLLENTLEPNVLEGYSKALTYSIPYADKSGWSLGHKMRIPDTLNYKYLHPAQVKVTISTTNQYNFEGEFEDIAAAVPAGFTEQETWTPQPILMPVRDLWNSIKTKVTKRARDEYDTRQPDRSDALFHLMTTLFRLGKTRDEVYALAKDSANNKWADNKYHADEDLAKDVLRAEDKATNGDVENLSDIERLAVFRKMGGTVEDRRKAIAAFVHDRLVQRGQFVSTTDGQDWYTAESEGRPTLLSRHNDHFNGILEQQFGLNAVEFDQKYTLNYLITQSRMRPVLGTTGILSHFDADLGRVALHTGRKDVLLIDQKGITVASNGDYGLIFPWRSNETPFEPDIGKPLNVARLFDGCFDNLIEMEHDEAVAIMRAWMVFLILRTDAVARPLLALFGQPGSGKSTMFRRVYAFLYGATKSLNSLTTPEDFDHAVSTDPLVVFDNVDSYEKWLPDRLALSAALSVVSRRKLYTDNEDVYLQRGALIGITAHNPQFRREDIVDRLLMFNFHRLDAFIPESRIMKDIQKRRNRLWGGLIADVQETLKIPQPTDKEIPPFRVNDFARIGLWTARANDYEDDFTSAIRKNAAEQVTFNLEEEDLLVDTIKRWHKRKDTNVDVYYSPTELWTRWRAVTRDSTNFERAYRSALKLGRKLWALHTTLKNVFDIDFKYEGEETGSVKLWRIKPMQ